MFECKKYIHAIFFNDIIIITIADLSIYYTIWIWKLQQK